MKIKFTESRWLKTEDRDKEPKFKKGSTHDLNEASAYRWVRRNVAVYVVEEAVPPKLKMDRPMMSQPPKIRYEVAKAVNAKPVNKTGRKAKRA